MCPPSSIPLAAENEYWTDEAIFMSLFDFKSGKQLPLNVTSDVNPYQYTPSDLPADLWYFCSGVKKDADCGFWLETGEAREIFSNPSIRGSRTTLQFYEGRAPHARKTDWVMQEYRITHKCDNNTKDGRALCRVFLADENRPPPGHIIANIDLKISINLEPKTVSNMKSKKDVSMSELLGKTMNNNTEFPDCLIENSSEMDCISRGDYFELNDLIDQGSRSSSSVNSSCLTMTSDECFDSMALLQEIDDEITASSVKFNLSAPIKSTEVVISPATSVSLITDEGMKNSAQETSKGGKSSSSSQNASKEGKKESVSRTKRRKLMKYICFLAF